MNVNIYDFSVSMYLYVSLSRSLPLSTRAPLPKTQYNPFLPSFSLPRTSIICDHLASQTDPVVAVSTAAMQPVTVALIAGGVLLLLGLVWLGFR